MDFSNILSNASDCLTKLLVLVGIYKNKNPQLLFTDNFLKGERLVGALQSLNTVNLPQNFAINWNYQVDCLKYVSICH